MLFDEFCTNGAGEALWQLMWFIPAGSTRLLFCQEDSDRFILAGQKIYQQKAASVPKTL